MILGKTIFQNFFRGKFHFFPTFLGENFPRNFPQNFHRKKMYEKSAPGVGCTGTPFKEAVSNAKLNSGQSNKKDLLISQSQTVFAY
jgi:hypothetical protein